MRGFVRARTCALVLGLVLAPVGARAALMTAFQQSGNLDMTIVGVPSLTAAATHSGSFGLSGLPGAALIVQAYVYTADWNSPGNPLDLTFGGVPILPDASPVTDTNLFATQHLYRWDVTPHVVGNGSYSFSIGGNGNGNQIYAAALAVVFGDPSLPSSTVILQDGAVQVGEGGGADSESTTFNLASGGATDLWLFTQADGVGGNELIQYNGNTIGGPIDANLGLNGSVFNLSTTSNAGNNTATLTANGDHYGWNVAGVVVTAPEPSALALLAFALLALSGRRAARS